MLFNWKKIFQVAFLEISFLRFIQKFVIQNTNTQQYWYFVGWIALRIVSMVVFL